MGAVRMWRGADSSVRINGKGDRGIKGDEGERRETPPSPLVKLGACESFANRLFSGRSTSGPQIHRDKRENFLLRGPLRIPLRPLR